MIRSAKTTFTGTYTVDANDDVIGTDVLSISSYSSVLWLKITMLKVAAPQALKSSDNTATIGTVKIDATPPTATLDESGHTYNASNGTLALKGADFDTMGVSDGGSVKENLRFYQVNLECGWAKLYHPGDVCFRYRNCCCNR